MEQTRILKLTFLSIGIFLAGFILLMVFCPQINDNVSDRVLDPLDDLFQQVKSLCLYGKLYERNTSSTNICAENLVKLDHAIQEWALDNNKSDDEIPTIGDLELYIKEWPKCPRGGTYSLNRIRETPICSVCGEWGNYKPPIFVGNLVLLGIEGFLVASLIYLLYTRHRRLRRAKLAIRLSEENSN